MFIMVKVIKNSGVQIGVKHPLIFSENVENEPCVL